MALEGGIGQFQMPLEQWFYELPLGTRVWTTGAILTSVLVQCNVVTPFQLFYSLRAVFVKNQYWRLATTFLYFGPLSLDLLLHVYFQQRYSRLLEEAFGTGATSTAHFSWMILYATTALLALSPLFSIPFLGHALSSTLIYIWSRRNPDTRLSLLGLATFTAPWLPLVFIGISFLMHGSLPKDEVCGAVVGHVYYFFMDVWPTMYDGQRPLDPPGWWLRLFEGPQQEHAPVEDEGTEEEVRWHQGQGAELNAAPGAH